MIAEKLKELNIIIPEAPKPLAAYVPAVRSGNMVFTSGQVPIEAGTIKYTGKAGAGVSDEDGKAAAQLCAVNCLSALLTVIPSLDNVVRIVKLTVFVNCTDGYTNQPEIANGASELMLGIFGDKGKHARSAVGASGLPRNAAVEVELIAEVRD